MQEIANVDSEAYVALVRALRNTGVSVIAPQDAKDDFLLQWDGHSAAIEIKAAGQGWPSDAQRMLNHYPASRRRTVVFFAPHFSETARQIFSEHASNWLDTSGIHVRLPGKALIHVDRGEDPPVPTRRLSWSRSAYEIAEYVLAKRPDRLKLADIAAATGWSKPMASKTLIQWDLVGWTAKRGLPRGASAWRELISPGGLLESWSAERSSSDKQGTQVHAHAVVRDPTSFAFGDLAAALQLAPEYAFTSWIAASQRAPFSTIVPTIHVYLPVATIESGAYEEILRSAGLKEVEEAGLVTLEAASPAVFRNSTREPVPVASDPRVYADLLRVGGRAADVAQHLRETRIGY